MKKTKVVCIGEALIDRIMNKSNQDFKDFLGGAPANVACALSKLKIESAFIGCLGKDIDGKKFIEEFNALGININFIQMINNYPTRIVKINRDNSGDRYFSGFYASGETVFADEVLNKNLIEKNLESLEKLFLQTKFIVAGTIILSSSISAESIYFLFNLASKLNVKIIVDLNWREVFWDYSNFSSKIVKKERINIIKQFLNYSHVLKLAKEEAILFFDNTNPFEISQQLANLPDVIITDGANPISWFINGNQGTTEVFKSHKILDTTGAGDAFLAGLISKLISLDKSSDKLEINESVQFASICGLLTCLGEGAIEPQPNYAKVKDFLGSQIL